MISLERSSQASVLASKVAKISDPAASVEKPCTLPVQNTVSRWVRFVGESSLNYRTPFGVQTSTIDAYGIPV